MRGLSVIACAIAALTAQSLPSTAEEFSLFSPQPTSTNRYGEAFGLWSILKDKDFDPRNAGFFVVKDDDFGGEIFVRCVIDRPDFLIALDRNNAVLNGNQASVRIKTDGQTERQFRGRVYGDRFVQLDDPLEAMAALVNATRFVVAIDASGVQSVLYFTAMDRPLRALANVVSQCQVPVSARGK